MTLLIVDCLLTVSSMTTLSDYMYSLVLVNFEFNQLASRKPRFSIMAAVFSDQDLSVLFREYLSSGYELNQSINMSFSCRMIMHVFASVNYHFKT